jgi:hypothetical protein
MTDPQAAGVPSAAPSITRRCAIIAAVLLLALFGVASYSESIMLPPIDDSDEPGYFNEACWIAEHGGPVGFAGACLRGSYPFDARHPLVQVLASPWAHRSLEAVRPMRAVHVALSVAALAGVFLLGRRIAGPHAALFLTALLALTVNWYAKSRVLTAEPVIYALFFAAWALTAGAVTPRWRWFMAGLMVGLAYLAKGTAMLILFAFPVAWAAWGLMEWRRRRAEPETVRRAWRPMLLKSALPFLAGFLLLGGLLLARNTVRYGNPLSNINDRLIWLDSWTDHVLLFQDDLKDAPSLGGYLRTHSAKQIDSRVAYGLQKETPRFLGGLAADQEFGRAVFGLTLVASVAIMLAGVWRVIRARASWTGVYTLSLLAVGFGLFTWHAQITFASRFMATFAPIFGIYAFAAGPGWFLNRPKIATLTRWSSLAIAVLAIVLLAGRTGWSDLTLPRGPVPMTPQYRWLLDWHEREVAHAGHACFQTPYLAPRYTFGWLLSDASKVYALPAAKSFEEVQRYMDSKGAKYLVVERDSLKERMNLFRDCFDYDAAGELRLLRAPPGWALEIRDPYAPAQFFIFKRVGR